MRTKQKLDIEKLHGELAKVAVVNAPKEKKYKRGKSGKAGRVATYSIIITEDNEIEITGLPEEEIVKVLKRLA